MKRFSGLLMSLLVPVMALAQTQQGVAYRYNGARQRTPLGNVMISYDNNRRTTVSAEQDGTFSLLLEGRKMGDRIGMVTVKKREMMVFNQHAVDEWSVRKEPLMLILCNADEFEKQKENLINIGRREAKKKYDKQKAELEAKLNASQIKEAEYEAALDKAYEELETLQKNMDKYVDAFVRIDLSEVSAEEQRILDMVHEGRIDEAVEAYEKLDISGKLRQARENKKALSEAKTKIEEEETRQDQVIEELIAKQEREIATLKLAGGKDNYEKIGRMLKENALADTTDVNVVLEYAYFAENQKDFAEAEHFYQICLNHCPTELLSRMLVWTGNFYKHIRKYTEAEPLYLSAVERARENSDSVWEEVAMNNLGLLYYQMRRFDEAETYYLACLNYRTQLHELEPNAENTSSLAVTQSNLGYLYTSKADSAKAEYYLFSALKNYELACGQNPSKYRSELADMQIRIAQYYLNFCKLYGWNIYVPKDDSIMVTKAERFYNDALENYRQLYSQEPDKYRGGLSNCLSLMGRFYRFVGKPAMALNSYQESFDLENIRYKNNPERFKEYQAISNNNMGIMCEEMKDTVNAEKYYSAAFSIYEELYKESPNVYFEGIKATSKNLCNIYEKMGDVVNYEKMLKITIELKDIEYKNNPSNPYTAVIRRKDLGRLYLELGRIDESKAIFYQAQQIDSTENANNNMAFWYKSLGNKSAKKKDYRKAKEYYLAAIDYYKAYLQESGKNFINDYIGETHWLLGDIYLTEKDTVQTETHYLQSLEYYTVLYQENPNNKVRRGDLAKTQHNLGNFYYKTGNYSQAEEYFLKSLENKQLLFSQNPEKYRERLALTQRSLADVYDDTKDYKKAEEYYLQALENYQVLFEKEADDYRAQLAWIQYSLMYIYAKDNEKLDQYDAMLDAALSNYEVLYQNGNSYQYQIVNLRNRKGSRLLKMNKIDDAISLFESTYKIKPEKSISYLASGYNAKAYEYAKTKDYDQAIETIDKAISLKPKEANYYDSKGEILLMKGDEQGALEMWQKVMELDPDFLSKHSGKTPLYEQLKERGLIE